MSCNSESSTICGQDFHDRPYPTARRRTCARATWSDAAGTRVACPAATGSPGSRPDRATRISASLQREVRYELKTPYRDGATRVLLGPPDFITRLAALVAKPGVNLTPHHGVFAPNSRQRALVRRAKRGKRAPPAVPPPVELSQRARAPGGDDLGVAPLAGRGGGSTPYWGQAGRQGEETGRDSRLEAGRERGATGKAREGPERLGARRWPTEHGGAGPWGSGGL